MFEEDLAGAREVHLVLTGRDQKVQPERPIDTADRRAREGPVGSGTGSGGIVTRVGSAAVKKSGAPLNTHEYALATATSGALLGSSLLLARFPRLVAWPLATAGALLGGVGVLRAARSAFFGDVPRLAKSEESEDSQPDGRKSRSEHGRETVPEAPSPQ